MISYRRFAFAAFTATTVKTITLTSMDALSASRILGVAFAIALVALSYTHLPREVKLVTIALITVTHAADGALWINLAAYAPEPAIVAQFVVSALVVVCGLLALASRRAAAVL